MCIDVSILSMFEYVRQFMIRKIRQRLEKALRWATTIPLIMHGRLNVSQQEGRHIPVIWARNDEYEVMKEKKAYHLHINQNKCKCRVWQLTEISCMHVMVCITYQRADPISYVHTSLKKSAYLATYESMIHPIPDETSWPEVEVYIVLPPQKRKLPGMPKFCRREPDEPRKEKRSVTLKYGVWKSLGDNKRTCPRFTNSVKRARANQGHMSTSEVQSSADAGPSVNVGE